MFRMKKMVIWKKAIKNLHRKQKKKKKKKVKQETGMI